MFNANSPDDKNFAPVIGTYATLGPQTVIMTAWFSYTICNSRNYILIHTSAAIISILLRAILSFLRMLS